MICVVDHISETMLGITAYDIYKQRANYSLYCDINDIIIRNAKKKHGELKPLFSLLFFEQRYLTYYISYCSEIFSMRS